MDALFSDWEGGNINFAFLMWLVFDKEFCSEWGGLCSQLRKIIRWFSYYGWIALYFLLLQPLEKKKKKKAAAAVAFQCRSARRVCRVVLDPAAVTLCFGGSRSERKALALSKGTLWFASWGHRARRNLKVYISKATMGGRQLKELMSGGREGKKGVEGYTFKTDERLEKN